jgi:tRNA dimethylallyltransferase
MQPAILVVAGPTACGKSSLGIRLAQALNGEVISLDSIQVYAELDIGSAKVSAAERALVPHHLLDRLTADQPCDAATYLGWAREAIDDIIARGKLPVVVGGTTMYLTALLHGLAELPPRAPEVRSRIEQMSPAERWGELQRLDARRAAELHPNDTLRVGRALETVLVSGEPFSEAVGGHRFSESFYRALCLVLWRPRAHLHSLIGARSAAMVEQGVVEETKGLIERYGGCAPGLQGIGYLEVSRMLRGELSNDALIEEISIATRRLAKRQMTFWRNEPAKRGWLVRPRENDPAVMIDDDAGGAKRAKNSIKGQPVLGFEEAELFRHVREALVGLSGIEVHHIEAR